MKKTLIILFFLHCLPMLMYGQAGFGQTGGPYEAQIPNILYPSPQAMAFMRYGEIPVNLSSGVPEISIPIHTIKANGMEFPISISYHASGIRVNDVSGTVGLGWVLNAGGMIAQTVYGWDDQGVNQEYHKLSTLPFDSRNSAYQLLNREAQANLSGFTINRWWYGCFTGFPLFGGVFTHETGNTISDRYNFNYNGSTGVFRYNLATNKYETIPYTPLKIEKKKQWNDGFIITDENGIKWTFGSLTDGSIAETKNPNLPIAMGMSSKEYHLTSVKFPGIKDSIVLTYSHGTQYIMTSRYESVFTGGENKFKPVNWDGYEVTNRHFHVNKRTKSEPIKTQSTAVLLKSIKWRNETISFSYDNNSPDLIKERLNKITITLNGETIHTVKLNQSSGGDRMFLDAINIDEEKYSFEYKNHWFPTYEGLSNYTDFWGYYNGKNSTEKVPFKWCLVSPYPTLGFAKRIYLPIKESNSQYTSTGILTKITYPTKGYTTFEYEQNKALGVYTALRQSDPIPHLECHIGLPPGGDNGDGPGRDDDNYDKDTIKWTPPPPTPPLDYETDPHIETPQLEPFGGVRIKKITNYDKLDGVTWKEYEYEGGPTVKPLPEHFCQRKEYYYLALSNNGAFQALPSIEDGVCSVELGSMSTESPLSEFGGQLAFYHKVTEYTGENNSRKGKVEYFYERNSYAQENGCGVNCLRNCDKGSIPPLLVNKKEYMYDQGSYTLKRETKNEYSKVNKGSFITGVQVEHGYEFMPSLFSFDQLPQGRDNLHAAYYGNRGFSKGFDFTNIYAIRDFMRLDSTETTEYLNGGAFSTTVKYGYNNKLLSPNRTTTHNSTGGTYIEFTTYPFDHRYTNLLYDTMTTQNILTPIVSKSARIGNQLADTIHYNYRKDGNLFVVDNISTAKGSAALESRIQYHKYDSYGNPLYITKDSTTKIVYLWGYLGKYPVVEIKNAEYQQVVSILTSNFITTLLSASFPSTMMNTIEALRYNTTLSEAQITTFYYKPGIGVSEIRDPNGMKTTFEYDLFGRLQTIKDHDENILERYTYHYAE